MKRAGGGGQQLKKCAKFFQISNIPINDEKPSI
jgi:hypothetical protein